LIYEARRSLMCSFVLLDNGQAIQMPNIDRLNRQARDYQYILKHPCALWSRSVLNDLYEDEQSSSSDKFTDLEPSQVRASGRLVHVGEHGELSALKFDSVVSAYAAARKRVLFLDYGGTLLEIEGVFVALPMPCEGCRGWFISSCRCWENGEAPLY
jgi:hypothetical protein